METIKTKDVQEMIVEVQDFKGELANEYKTRMDYVNEGGFEKDYFSAWLEGCSDYPYMSEIVEMATHINEMVDEWIAAVDDGEIDPEAGWAN